MNYLIFLSTDNELYVDGSSFSMMVVHTHRNPIYLGQDWKHYQRRYQSRNTNWYRDH